MIMRITKKALVGIGIVFILVVLYLTGKAILPSWTLPIFGENSVATIEKVNLGGIEQYILIRGQDKEKPIMLFLHGGPGYPQIDYIRKYEQDLEKNFIVVNWDQRGAGKSYHEGLDQQSLKMDQFVSDTHELTQMLLKRFHKKKLYLVGHSWGSAIGLLVAKKYPEDYYAYIGVGQGVEWSENEQIGYQFALDKARKRNNKDAITELEQIGPPPYRDLMKGTAIERKWVMAFGGSERKVQTAKEHLLSILFSPEYRLVDLIKLSKGNKLSSTMILPQLENFNAFEEVPKLKIPTYFCEGKYDYDTAFPLVEKYYERLDAPKKQFFWFNKSAHWPQLDQQKKFSDVLLTIQKDTMN